MSVLLAGAFSAAALGHRMFDFVGIRARKVFTTLNNKSARVKMSEDVNELNTQELGQHCLLD